MSAAAAFSQWAGQVISAVMAECLPESTCKQCGPKHVHSRSRSRSFVEIQAAMMFCGVGTDQRAAANCPWAELPYSIVTQPSSWLGARRGGGHLSWIGTPEVMSDTAHAGAATPPISGNCVWRRVVKLQFAAGKSAAAAFSELAGPAISAALAECLPEFTVKQGSPKHVHSRSQASFVEIQAAMFDEAGADKQYCPKRPCSSSLTPSAADPSSEAGFQVGRLFRCPLTVLFKSGCGFLRIGTQASARQMRRAVGGTPAESTLAVSVEITHRSRTVLSACGHFLQVQFLRELDPSCRAATDSVSPVQSGMPLAQFLGLHVPCGAIQEAEKRSSLAHLQMPCSDRRHIATKTGQQKVCGASWCFPRRVVLHFGPSATWQLQSVASLARTAKPLLLPIGASRIQQPTDKKMRAAFCKLTSKLSASSLEDLGLMELPSAHKKDMSVVRCGSFWPAAVDASREGRAEMLPVCGVLASKNTWQCISIVVAPALQHAWPATCRDVRFLEFLCGAVPRKPALPLLFFGTALSVAHPIRAGQAADILER
ncbi:unnamed protein product, partial [Polarella glacialis]